eukprot:scaffold75049_cov78-Phaeocystis_antarctica.AAC.2
MARHACQNERCGTLVLGVGIGAVLEEQVGACGVALLARVAERGHAAVPVELRGLVAFGKVAKQLVLHGRDPSPLLVLFCALKYLSHCTLHVRVVIGLVSRRLDLGLHCLGRLVGAAAVFYWPIVLVLVGGVQQHVRLDHPAEWSASKAGLSCCYNLRGLRTHLGELRGRPAVAAHGYEEVEEGRQGAMDVVIRASLACSLALLALLALLLQQAMSEQSEEAEQVRHVLRRALGECWRAVGAT